MVSNHIDPAYRWFRNVSSFARTSRCLPCRRASCESINPFTFWPTYDYYPCSTVIGRLYFHAESTRPLVCGLAAILFVSHFPFGQANVNESLETASSYVDGTKGSDSNSGSQSRPLKTIGAAASMAQTNNQNSIGSGSSINPGTYRESISAQSQAAKTPAFPLHSRPRPTER